MSKDQERDNNKISIGNLVLVLTAVCAVAALALAGVYQVTKEPIAEQIRLARLKAIKAVLPPYDNQPDQETEEFVVGKGRQGNDVTVTVYKASQGGQPAGMAFSMVAKGFGGDITVMLGVTPDEKVSGVEILLHKETPGLGAKVEKSAFRGQFVGKGLADSLTIKKDGGEIDQITGASISSRAVSKAVEKGLSFYHEKYGQQGE